MALPTPTSTRKKRHSARVLARQQDVLRMKIAGISHRQIAAQYGVSEVQIDKDLKNVLGEMARANNEHGQADELRALYTMRYEALYARWLPRALGRPAGRDPETGDPTPETPPDLDALYAVLRILSNLRLMNAVDVNEHGFNAVFQHTTINQDNRSVSLNGDPRDPNDDLGHVLAALAEAGALPLPSAEGAADNGHQPPADQVHAP